MLVAGVIRECLPKQMCFYLSSHAFFSSSKCLFGKDVRVFSHASAKAERDLSSLYSVFLYVE